LERLDAFELVNGPGNNDTMPGMVRLRWEAVTALAFKSLGTKPKAGAPTPKAGGATPSEADTTTAAVESPVAIPARTSNGFGVESPSSKAAARPDPAWRQKVGERQISQRDPRFSQRQAEVSVRESQPEELPVEPDMEAGARSGAAYVNPGGAAPSAERSTAGSAVKLKGEQLAPTGRAKAALTRPRDPSSGSESSSQQEREAKRKQRKKEKRKMGMLGYGDYFGRGHSDLPITPEVMMMNQMNMMSMGMMMNNPLAMMGMGNPYQMQMLSAAGMKQKKDDKPRKAMQAKEHDRARPRVASSKEAPEDPRVGKPAAAPSKDAMIDAADL
jgi:hypothetical protein